MTKSQLVGKKVHIFVSDPWEFGTECGVGSFTAMIAETEPRLLLLQLEGPVEYRGARLQTVLARPRHAPGTIDPLISEGGLSANLNFFRVRVTTLSQLNDAAKAGMVAAIGSVESLATEA